MPWCEYAVSKPWHERWALRCCPSCPLLLVAPWFRRLQWCWLGVRFPSSATEHHFCKRSVSLAIFYTNIPSQYYIVIALHCFTSVLMIIPVYSLWMPFECQSTSAKYCVWLWWALYLWGPFIVLACLILSCVLHLLSPTPRTQAWNHSIVVTSLGDFNSITRLPLDSRNRWDTSFTVWLLVTHATILNHRPNTSMHTAAGLLGPHVINMSPPFHITSVFDNYISRWYSCPCCVSIFVEHPLVFSPCWTPGFGNIITHRLVYCCPESPTNSAFYCRRFWIV